MDMDFWKPVITALVKVVVLAFLVERALAVIFDMDRVREASKRLDFKPVIAILVSVAACLALQLDAVAPLAASQVSVLGGPSTLGAILTGFVVAGGSAGAVKLFQDVLGFRRSSREQLKAVEDAERQADLAEAQARTEKAKADIAGAQTATVAANSGILGAPGGSPEERILASRIAVRDLKISRGTARL